jgi:glyoxylase-like metal-dependent hydrolase (beta-lactamase superfamily II)
MQVTRRTVLAGTATAASAAALGLEVGPLQAAAGAATTQAPGYYRYKVGSMLVTVVTDGMRDAPLGNIVRNAPKEEVNAALAAAYLPPDKFPFVFTPCVVNTGSKQVMIDTGMGPTVYAQSKGAGGQTHTNLAAAGIDRNAIDLVIISHFHGDHINGLLNADGTSAFPKAEITVPEPEWAYWMDDSKASNAPEGLKGNFANVRRVFGPLAKQVTKYGDKKEITPGITSMFTHGHTPGHSSHILSSGSSTAVLQADVTNHPALFVRHPEWHASFDMDPNMAESVRRKLYDQLSADKTRMQGFHFPFPSNGHIEKDGKGYRFVPAAWNPTI